MIQERHCFWGLAKEAGAQPAFLRLANGNAVLPTFFRHMSFRARGAIGGVERLPFRKAGSAASRRLTRHSRLKRAANKAVNRHTLVELTVRVRGPSECHRPDIHS